MKRFHVHVGVGDLEAAVRFYSTLFGADPSRREADYAKWMLDDPRVNFAISSRGGDAGLRHLGIQADDQAELDELAVRAGAAADAVLVEKDAACCYARSNKAWVEDPAGIRWETFFTFGDATTYGQSAAETVAPTTTERPARCCG